VNPEVLAEQVAELRRQLDRMDAHGTKAVQNLVADLAASRAKLERLEGAGPLEKLAVVDERTRTLAETVSKMVEQIESMKGRITAFGFTIAGGAVLFAVSTVIQVLGR
jgi:uncharacterized protein (DUF2342 family)